MYSTLGQMMGDYYHPQRNTNSLTSLSNDAQAQALANRHGLRIQNVSWEDTARTKDSCWGPNISDMTLHVDGQGNMPAIRKPNFSDVTCDVNPNDYHVTVGNEDGSALRRVSLTEYLRNFCDYNSGVELKSPLYTERDSRILASAQACLLPLKDGEVEFNVQLYNYQSYDDDSACLVIVASAQGTSAQIIKGRTQKLYFRLKDQKANFVAKRLADDRRDRGVSTTGQMSGEEQERNVLFVYQIPLKHQKEHHSRMVYTQSFGLECCAMSDSTSISNARGMDHAVLRHGSGFGEWETPSQVLERDTRWPIRLTLQYYKVTDETTVSDANMTEISEQVSKIYNNASATGSLVTSTGTRPTEPTQPPMCRVDPILHAQKPLMPF